MGIYLILHLSKSITQREWKPVYEETLKLIKEFPLVERRKTNIDGIDVMCLVPTQEREFVRNYGRDNCYGWEAEGDAESLALAEAFFLPKTLPFDADASAGDAILDDVAWRISREQKNKDTYTIWSDKTQGEPYHMYLLAVAALISDRLGNKAFVSGDITRGQLTGAVRMANEILEKKIELPDACDLDRFAARIKQLDIPESEKVEAYEDFILSKKDLEFGEAMRRHFSLSSISDYWKGRFAHYPLKAIGFKKTLYDYMRWGFELKGLSSYVHDKDTSEYEQIIELILKTKCYKENSCLASRPIDQEAAYPYGLGTLFADMAYDNLYRQQVGIHIPFTELQDILRNEFGKVCNVDEVIQRYLADTRHEKSDNRFADRIQEERIKFQKMQEEYSIYIARFLKFYEKGDRILPELLASVKKTRAFLNEVLDEEMYRELLEEDDFIKCQWLANNNHYFLLRESDWRKIFSDVKENPDSFERYYPLLRVKANSTTVYDQCVAFLLNRQLYDFAGEQ